MNNCDLMDFSQDLAGFEDINNCPICFIDLEDSPYAMINNTSEKGRYHVECLERWLNKSRNGILTQDKIKGYTVYHEDTQIESIKLPPLIPLRSNRTSENYESNQRRNYNNEPNCCFCVVI